MKITKPWEKWKKIQAARLEAMLDEKHLDFTDAAAEMLASMKGADVREEMAAPRGTPIPYVEIEIEVRDE